MSVKTVARDIQVEQLGRIEGEGSLRVKIDKKGHVQEIYLKIFEPPRFFEGFMVGRHAREVSDLCSRICGICSISHHLTSIQAVEAALGVEISPQTWKLRHLLSLGEHFMNLTVHVYMLAAPDYLGYPSVLHFKPEHLFLLERAVKIQQAGNQLMRIVGGHETHPPAVVINGFTRLPTRKEIERVRGLIASLAADVEATVRWAAEVPLPDFKFETELVSLKSDTEYPRIRGDIASTKGLRIPVSNHHQYIKELRDNAPGYHALQYVVDGRESFMAGPLARVSLNWDRLHPDARELAQSVGVPLDPTNPFHNLGARAVEIMHCQREILEVMDGLVPVEEDCSYQIHPGTGHACGEAPRGLLYYQYKVDENGLVQFADIITPTAHHSRNIQHALEAFAPQVADLPDEGTSLACQKLIRAYDPCLSCSVH